MNIRVFGNLNDIIKSPPEIEFPVTLGEFRGILYAKFPELESLVIKIAINQQITEDEALLLTENSEIALLPPFSGG